MSEGCVRKELTLGEVRAEELTLVVWAQESWWADQLSYFPGPDPGF